MTADSDRAAAWLAEVRALITARDELLSPGAGVIPSVSVGEFNAAQDRLAERAPPLAAALEAVLALADKWDAADHGNSALTEDRAWTRQACAAQLLEAVAAELPGESRPGLRETGEWPDG